MLVSEEGKIRVNLVTDDDEMVVIAEVGKPLQRFFRPANTTWIMRIAEDEDTALIIADALQTVEIHIVALTRCLHTITFLGFHLQRIPDYLAAISTWHEEEGMIDGWHDDDLLVRLAKKVSNDTYTLHNARDEVDPLGLNLPSMVLSDPVDDGRTIVIGLYCIS